MPSHHQAGFFAALVGRGVDLRVCYYSQVDQHRLSMGWRASELKTYEVAFTDLAQMELQIPDWRERIHILSGIGEPFCRRLLIVLIRKKIKWVHWSEGFRFRWRSLLTTPLQILYARLIINSFALGLLASGTHAYRQFSRWGVMRHKLAILPYSIHPLPMLAKEEGKFTFLFLGSIENRKGVDTLIRAFSLLPGDWQVQLKIVGRVAEGRNEHSLEYYQSMAKHSGAGDKIEFHPAVTVDQISETIAACDVLILPSRFDGFGVVVSEAAAMKKLIIASDQVGSAETVIDNGVNGFIFQAENATALATCLRAAYRVAFQEVRAEISAQRFNQVEASQNAERLELILDAFLNMR